MKKNKDNNPIDVLGKIYETLYEDSVSAFHKTEKKTSETFHKLIDDSGEFLAEASEFSKEHIQEASEYVKRDINDAAYFLSSTGKELSEWLGFELELLEDKVVERLLDAVDPVTLDLLKLKEQAKEKTVLHTGQITGPGMLECNSCGEILHYYKIGRIPPCPKCHKTDYHRAIR